MFKCKNWENYQWIIIINTVEPRYLELTYFELTLISKWKSGPCFNMKLWQQVTKLCGKEEQFLLFSTLFYIYFSNFRSQITYSFVKCGCSIYCFPHSLNSDMSKYGYLEVFQWVHWNSRQRESTVSSHTLLSLFHKTISLLVCFIIAENGNYTVATQMSTQKICLAFQYSNL